MDHITAFYVLWWIIYYIMAHFAAFYVARSVLWLDSTLFVPVQSVWKVFFAQKKPSVCIAICVKSFFHTEKSLYLYLYLYQSVWKVFFSQKKPSILYLVREPSWATSGWKPSEEWHWKENFALVIIVTIIIIISIIISYHYHLVPFMS